MKKNYILIAFAPLFLAACAGNVNHRWCPPVEIVKEELPIVYEKETIKLSADALFNFDKAGVDDLLPKGKAELNHLISQLKSNYIEVKQIDIVGHTDRLGSPQYNMKLGLQRAETVRNYLQNAGINTTYQISSKGMLEPITTDCDQMMSREKLKACLQPDRCVSLEIMGIKQAIH